MKQKKNTKLSIKNMTDDGVKTGIFTLLIEGKFIKLACEECIKIDPQAPTFLHAKFTNDTCTRLNVYCPVCGFSQQGMDAEDCPAPFAIEPK